MSKAGQGVNGVIVKDDSIEKAIRRFIKITSMVCAEHKKATEFYEKPSAKKHAKKQEIKKRKEVK